ncbi:MAG: hypothetical protein ACPIOQ_76735, partial [Promethearchaeia archaeon]
MKNYLLSTAAPCVGAHRAHRHGNENDRRDCGESDGHDAAPSGRALHRHDPLHARTEHCFGVVESDIFRASSLFSVSWNITSAGKGVAYSRRREPERAGGGANQVREGTPVRAGEAA